MPDSFGMQVFSDAGYSYDSSISAPRVYASGSIILDASGANVHIDIEDFTISNAFSIFIEPVYFGISLSLAISILPDATGVTFINPRNYPARYAPLTITKTVYDYIVFKNY